MTGAEWVSSAILVATSDFDSRVRVLLQRKTPGIGVAEVTEVTEVTDVIEFTEVTKVTEVTEVTEIIEVSDAIEVTSVTEEALGHYRHPTYTARPDIIIIITLS